MERPLNGPDPQTVTKNAGPLAGVVVEGRRMAPPLAARIGCK